MPHLRHIRDTTLMMCDHLLRRSNERRTIHHYPRNNWREVMRGETTAIYHSSTRLKTEEDTQK